MSREICHNCDRPKRVCLCSAISNVSSPYDIIVLQHPKEVGIYNNTVKLLELCVNEVTVFVGEKWADLESIGLKHDGHSFLIFPGEDAMSNFDKEALSFKFNRSGPRITIVLIDGTWRQAKKIYRENEWLKSIPKFSFSNGKYLSNYTIRKEPKDGFLSTLEAVVYTVREASGDGQWGEALFKLLQTMVDNQLRFDPRKIR